jgi:hypothetical protein
MPSLWLLLLPLLSMFHFLLPLPSPSFHLCHSCHVLKEYAQAEGVLAGFGVDLESMSDLSRGIGVSETAEYWEKVQPTSARPHVDLVPGGNGTGMRLMYADT